ncbi:putative bifunctional diguanylate cyclase/phosphodiesterase [uncultured Sphingomonas sp.]|uniref:putative bifunctional diguanylate cyclase/phosphodiesterase n=1 Tax=uncultured Sphingomonas sp. TaxID=158754 RepID=UPI0035CBA4A1
MYSDNPDRWTAASAATPADSAPTRDAGDERLDRVARTVAAVTGCDIVMIYRRGANGLTLAAGSGPARLAADRFDDAWRGGSDFVQFAADPATPGALAELGLSGRLTDIPACFAAAARMTGDGPGDRADRGVLVVGNRGPRALLNAAESYLLRAHAEQVAAVFELQDAQRQIAGQPDHLASIERLRLLETVATHARDSIIITEAEPTDMPGPRILFCNEAFTRTTGYTSEEVLGRTPRILQGPKTDPVIRAKLRAAFAAWEPVSVELVNYRKDGTEFWVELSIVPVADERGWYTHWVSVQRDVTERREAHELSARIRVAEEEKAELAGEIRERRRVEEELLYTAFHDNLTRLRNRAYFMQRLDSVVSRAGSSFTGCAVLFLDLDRFKVVNDSLGHQAGDMLLKEISRRLKTCARPQDTLARLGGDEFALLIEDVPDDSVPIQVARRMLDALRAPVRIGRQEVFPSCSIGVVHSADPGLHPEALIRDADIAMYVAKRAGYGEYSVYDDSMHAEATAALELQTDLQLAIERGEFEVAYQPIVDPQYGRIKSFEALIRWRHPTRGLIPPIAFVPVAEEIGLIRQIDRWVMREACAQLARWRERFPDGDLGMAVNTSASEFDDPEFLALLRSTLAEHGLPPRALQLEITESIFLDPDPRIAGIIADVRAHGVRVGLDDFGTGYSSLSYLNRYPTDTIKIDKSFIEGLCSDDRTLAIVLLIIQLAGTLGVDVVAEGVETEEQAQLLASMSCSHAQGYYFARPMSAADITATLTRSLHLAGDPPALAA